MWEAFNVLSPSRNVGMGAGAIPLSEVKAYCEMFDVAGQEKEDLLYLIRALDDEYLKITNEKHRRKGKR